MKFRKLYYPFIAAAVILTACNKPKESSITEKSEAMFNGTKGEVKLMTLDPGHFHAALIQKIMYEQVNPVVHIYAPDGPDLKDHIMRVESYNSREESPTSWDLMVYKGDDFFEKMLSDRAGNLMNVSGNNARKADYILKTIEAGINVLADKPMVISPEDFPKLEKVFKVAEEKGLLLYDIMTERYEITTMLQRSMSQVPEVFGELLVGSIDEPAITKESVHHFFKYVSGKALKRPAWFFDTEQQGEGIADITTHLVDLIQWEALPNVILSRSDVELLSARRWYTELTLKQFEKVTFLSKFPDFLQKDVVNGILNVYCNGELNYKLKGFHAKTSVIWNFQAPEGSADTHYSIMRGSKSNLIIEQGEKEGYKPKLYIESTSESDLSQGLKNAIIKLNESFPGLELEKIDDNKWIVNIPDKYKVGHEAHFGQVTEKYLRFLKEGKLPEWEVPNMITKYYTTTEGLKMAK